MKINSSRFSVFLGSIALLASQHALASALDDLTPEQKAKVMNHELVAVYNTDKGGPWPEAKVYKLVKTSAENAAAVFSDFVRQKEYFPDVRKSEVATVDDATRTLHV